MSDPVAYFLTWHTYGTWLHGHERGSVDHQHHEFGSELAPPDPDRLARNAELLVHDAITLDEPRRRAVHAAIKEVCAHRKWTLLALHVRTTHVHAVVAATATPEKILTDFKAYATRRLRKESLATADTRVWSHHGSTRYLWKNNDLTEAIDYVVNRQGMPLEPAPHCEPEPGSPNSEPRA